jgi:hypothetical protein
MGGYFPLRTVVKSGSVLVDVLNVSAPCIRTLGSVMDGFTLRVLRRDQSLCNTPVVEIICVVTCQKIVSVETEPNFLYELFPPHLRVWGYIFNSTSIDPNLMPLGSV